jgi:hypothetical protein
MNAALPPLDAAAGADLIEPYMNAPSLFSGVRIFVVGDVAHMIFYNQQPDCNGKPEFVVTARLAAPIGKAKAAIQMLACGVGDQAAQLALFTPIDGHAN